MSDISTLQKSGTGIRVRCRTGGNKCEKKDGLLDQPTTVVPLLYSDILQSENEFLRDHLKSLLKILTSFYFDTNIWQ
jgi:hypothetical protein